MTFSLRPRSVSIEPLIAGFGEHAGGLLEAGGRDEAVGRERRLGDAEEQRTADCGTATLP